VQISSTNTAENKYDTDEVRRIYSRAEPTNQTSDKNHFRTP